MNLVSEKIDERILRLLGLEDIFDIDYDTYYNLIREAMVAGTKKLPQEELAVLSNERKRIRGKKGRFKPKKITANKVATLKFLKPAKKTLALAPSSTTSPEEGGGFVEIKKTLDSILKTLGSKFKFDQKRSDQDRKEEETEKRGKKESTLEGFKKGVSGIVAVTKKILSPFQAIIDRIWKFIFFTLLGRAFTKFMDWMSDKGNQEKFNSFIKFLTDHWPALAGLYILFGTSFGKLVRGLLKGVTRMIVALVMNIGKIKKFIGKNKKLAFLGLALAPLASRELGNLLGENKETPESGLIPTTNRDLDQAKQSTDQAANTKVPKLNLGGMVPSFKMGGINPFGGMDFSGGVPITGAGQDDTLIAAKTGEAILTEKDQQDIGQRYVDSTTGQPLNIPQYLAGRKPGNVSMGSLKFPGFGGGFFDGGVISKFNNGGIVGGIQNFIGGMGNLFKGERAKATQSPIRTPKPTKIPDYQLPEAKSLLKSIKTAEHYKGTKDPYNTLYGGGSAPITQMTVKEVIDMYTSRKIPKRLGGTSVKYGSGSGAAGAYQFMPFTLEDLIRRGEVKPHQMMTSDLQDKMGWALARNRGVSIQSLKKSGLSQSILDKIAPEWASLPYSGAGGASFYGQPVKGADSLRQTYQQSLPQKKKGGGLLTKLGGIGKVEESEKGSFNIPGATADRQLFSIMGGGTAALQPGEFVIPFDTVKHFGPSFFEKLVAMTDSNSDAYLKKGKIGGPQITPYKTFGSGSGGMMTLPPITQPAGGSIARSAGLGGGSEVPDFSATAPNNERAMNASIYGLVG